MALFGRRRSPDQRRTCSTDSLNRQEDKRTAGAARPPSRGRDFRRTGSGVGRCGESRQRCHQPQSRSAPSAGGRELSCARSAGVAGGRGTLGGATDDPPLAVGIPAVGIPALGLPAVGRPAQTNSKPASPRSPHRRPSRRRYRRRPRHWRRWRPRHQRSPQQRASGGAGAADNKVVAMPQEHRRPPARSRRTGHHCLAACPMDLSQAGELPRRPRRCRRPRGSPADLGYGTRGERTGQRPGEYPEQRHEPAEEDHPHAVHAGRGLFEALGEL